MSARIPQLDGIRGIAILLVVWWHYYNCSGGSGWLATATNWTWAGVDVFFVLSGYLITGILIDEARATNLLSVFYWRRAARILPLYFLTLTAVYVQESFRRSSVVFPDWYHLTLTQNIIMGREGYGVSPIPVTWSLAIEEQFYLVWPLGVILVGERRIPIVSMVLISAAVIFRVASPGLNEFVGTFCRMDSLLFGALGAVLIRREGWLRLAMRNRKWILVLAGAAFSLGYWLQMHHQLGVLKHTMFGITGLMLILAAIDAGSLLARILSFQVLRWFGRISYPLYLVHESLRIFGSWWADVFVSVSVAAALHYSVESFFVRLGKSAEYMHLPTKSGGCES